MLTTICLFLGLCYGILLLAYAFGWQLQHPFVRQDDHIPQTKISIVIPARNEAAHIEACLRAIAAQRYPAHLYEVIVVDDHSEDDTASRVLTFLPMKVRLLSLQDHVQGPVAAYKKKALDLAISESTGELILTTDADCIAPPDWLANIAAYYELTGASMIVAPVDFTTTGKIVSLFQSLDFMTMQGITAAAYRLKLGNMANGANLAFSRAAYTAVGGYAGIDHLASGDDYLLMVKIQERFPKGIRYLLSQQAVVRTAPQPDWPSFLQQRIRWASKSGKYKDHRLTAILILVYLFNCSFLVLLLAGLFRIVFLKLFIGLLLWKTVLEILFLWPVSGFFQKRDQLLFFPFLQPLHIAYIILAGFLGFKGNFTWKGRRVK